MQLYAMAFAELQEFALIEKEVGYKWYQEQYVSYREAAKCEDLPIHEENSCVVTACCDLDTRTWKGLHQSWRTPSR